MSVVDTYHVGPLSFFLLKTTSGCAEHPTATIHALPETVVLGGGAFVDWSGHCAGFNAAGNLLTAMYPDDRGSTWTVASKDHKVVSPASITGYCVVAKMKDGSAIPASEYKVVSDTSAIAAHPTLQVDLPEGFSVVGGGARANWTGEGSLLFASYPTPGGGGWVGAAKDHELSDPSTITVWAIGLRKSFLEKFGLTVSLVNATSSPPVNHPEETLVLPNFHLTGVGARTNWHSAGNLLTASFPQDHQTVIAKAKDHDVADPSTVTAYAIGFKG